MKSSTKLLIALLSLSAFMPLTAALLGTFNHAAAADMFLKAPNSPAYTKFWIVIAACMYGYVALYGLAIKWVINGDRHGYSLSMLAGYITVGTGIFMMLALNAYGINDIMLGATDIVKGILILALTRIARAGNIAQPAMRAA
jgi:hypothetical protein